jgi:hypothetical protein
MNRRENVSRFTGLSHEMIIFKKQLEVSSSAEGGTRQCFGSGLDIDSVGPLDPVPDWESSQAKVVPIKRKKREKNPCLKSSLLGFEAFLESECSKLLFQIAMTIIGGESSWRA